MENTRSKPRRTKEEVEHARWHKKHLANQKEEARTKKKLIKREEGLLKFMLKHDVLFHHHGKADSQKKEIKTRLAHLKSGKDHLEYHPYIWNYQGEGNDVMPLSQLGCLWRSKDFKTIYDVPLDGTYRFYMYDSGNRGLGAFSHITACPVSELPSVPEVNPGALFPITVP